MLSKSQLKLITSLHQKKYRNQHGLFFIEGVKGVNEFLNSGIRLHSVYGTEGSELLLHTNDFIQISESDLRKISALKTPNKVLAVFYIPAPGPLAENNLILALDDIRDPGNLGTIIRLCDWFGITQLICSAETVDCYNPKVIQATMGSLSRVNIVYKDLEEFLEKTKLEVFAADMDGENVYKTQLPSEGVLIMGNEANGISASINKYINRRLTIPRFGALQQTESLNVATATAILLSEFKRIGL